MPNRSEQRNQSKRRTDWVVRIPLFFACIATATLALLDSVGVRGVPRRGRSEPNRLMLEVLLWPVERDSEQGVMLHVCSKAFQRRPFRMPWSEVGARRALGAVGGAWRDSATMCYSGPGAGRSGGVLPGPVALRALEVASYRRSRGQGSGSTTHL